MSQNKDTIRLTESQKRIIYLMRECGYLLVWSKQYFFWQFYKHGKSVNKNISSITAKYILSIGLLEIVQDIANTQITYSLSELGKTINIDTP